MPAGFGLFNTALCCVLDTVGTLYYSNWDLQLISILLLIDQGSAAALNQCPNNGLCYHVILYLLSVTWCLVSMVNKASRVTSHYTTAERQENKVKYANDFLLYKLN